MNDVLKVQRKNVGHKSEVSRTHQLQNCLFSLQEKKKTGDHACDKSIQTKKYLNSFVVVVVCLFEVQINYAVRLFF